MILGVLGTRVKRNERSSIHVHRIIMQDNNCYRYTPVVSDQMRLVSLCLGRWTDSISCKMRVVQGRCHHQYEALSYVWGNQQDKQTILIDGFCFAVTPTLESALRHLRLPSEERCLWIDQICINQSDDAEKSQQVALMSDIYKNAAQVSIWVGHQKNLESPSSSLGDGFTPDEVRTAVALLSALSFDQHLSSLACFQLSDVHRLQLGESFLPGFEVLCRLMQMPWWTRIWTVQEIVLSRQATFLLGSCKVKWDDLEKAALNLRKHRGGCCRGLFGTFTQEQFDKLNQFYLPIFDIARYREFRGLRDPSQGPDLILTLHRFRNRHSWDPRDKIYGLLGLLLSTQRVPVDYHRDFTCVYIDLMMVIIGEENNIRVLLDFKPEQEQQTDLPSWVVDWRNPANSSRLRIQLFRYDRYSAWLGPPRARLIQKSLLQLSGVRIDQIAVLQIPVKFLKGSYVYAALDKIRKLAASTFKSSVPYVAGGTIEEALRKTLLGDLVWEAATPGYRAVTEEDYELYEEFCSAKRPWSREDTYYDIANTVEQSLFDRTFFITTAGYIGIGPPTLRAGDDVFVVKGSNVPLVLRGRDMSVICDDQDTEAGSLYFFVGDCYVHGIMDGQVPKQSVKQLEPILLC